MTPKKRELIYTSFAGIIPVLIALGFLTDELGQAILGLIASSLTVAGLLLAKRNVPKG